MAGSKHSHDSHSLEIIKNKQTLKTLNIKYAN